MSGDWESVEGKMVEVSEEAVKYTYVVDGEEHTGDRYSYSGIFEDIDRGEFSVGKEVTVYYSGGGASDSTLQTGAEIALMFFCHWFIGGDDSDGDCFEEGEGFYREIAWGV